VRQAAGAERGDLLVEFGADPGDLRLGDATVDAQRLDQVVDLAGGGAITTANSARSIRRRGSSNDGKNEPSRSFGMRSSMSPALVDSSRARVPLR
jgi:hypothetical protein